MAKFVISGLASAIADDPRDGEMVSKTETLAALHGLASDESCLEYLDLGDLAEVIIGGGRLRFVYSPEEQALRITTAYDVLRDLTPEERNLLIEETVGQWSDGAGSGSFSNQHGEVLSAALAMSLQNSYGDEIELGSIFVDAYPSIEDQEITAEFFPEGSSDDDLIADLETAAEAGDLNALVMLGQKYEAGDGVEEDEAKAFRFYWRAAEEDYPPALAFAGYCMMRGAGCEQDPEQAVELLSRSAEGGFPFAMQCLGECYTQGIGTEIDLDRAFQYYSMGAEIGDPGCMAELGDCFEFGRGTDINYEEALNCYEQALEQGFTPVEEAIDRVNQKISQS